MKRTHREKELTQLQSLKKENEKLKREIASLRKQLARMDLDRHSYVRDIVEEHLAQQDAEETTIQMVKRLKAEWKCKECEDGHLEVFTFSKMSEPWYYRICSNAPRCKNRTKAQKYTPDVRGIMKDDLAKSK